MRWLRLILIILVCPAVARAQRPMVSATLTGVASSGDWVARSCLESNYPLGLGAQLSTPALTRSISVEINARAYGIDFGSECVDGFPPPDGTYIQDDRVDLLSRSFVTTDIRIAARPRAGPVTIALGGGNAWHEGHNLPYAVLETGLALWSRSTYEIRLMGELHLLRATADRFRRTYQDFELVSSESLGLVHRWSHALVFGVSAGAPL
jgi:hypothetical protein